MFGISFEELLILAVLAFILFGPQKLPEYAAKAGRLVAKLRQATTELTREVQNPFQYPPEPALPPAAGGLICPHCRHQLDFDFAFCPNCGQKIKEESDSPYPPPPQTPQVPETESLTAAASSSIPAPPATETAAVAPAPPAPAPEQIMFYPLRDDETETALEIINTAAEAYKGVIPADCWQEPYMPRDELLAEIAMGVEFWTAWQGDRLLGVMGRQGKGPVTLIRHAYVRPGAQQLGIGAGMLAHLVQGIATPILVGTWAAAWWAIRFYEKYGFKMVTQREKDLLLRTYWTISDRQVQTSVVLADTRWFIQGRQLLDPEAAPPE